MVIVVLVVEREVQEATEMEQEALAALVME
jgi:hypothetical protein